ncbi:uroporphyrinogen-III synthase [Psychrobacillus vulpis]|uniref:Uroporphyrinogen-III synthase n=1 Tax=Psychrobacillus vulpis TaxID=2325572 RepID=A0A544TR25_9BACI|nr:uroporphyrinogen-III synthase [Psychrobacillus vulpis]TQR19896.1 uroporphyrinogen-III synthase [Psychrobacillus vulpis]
MSNRLPLQGEYVIFTGIPRSMEAANLTVQFGGNAVIAPLIRTEEIVSQNDEEKMLACNTYDWLIFTSQSSVNAFYSKMKRYKLDVSFFRSKIAAVGSQTALSLEKMGFSVHFTPTIFSADVFVKEFPAKVSSRETCLFFRGNLAKNTISDGLSNKVDEWTVYETKELEENKQQIFSLIESNNRCSIIFTSPSTVEVFQKNIASKVGYDSFTICAIGHVTKDFLQTLGATVNVMPETYTLTEVIHELVKWKGRET